MPLRMQAFCSYLTTGGGRGTDMNAIAFIHAIKQEPIKSKYAYIPIRGGRWKLTPENAGRAGGFFALWAAEQLRSFGQPPYVIICATTIVVPGGRRLA